jgi:hypothetical protein
MAKKGRIEARSWVGQKFRMILGFTHTYTFWVPGEDKGRSDVQWSIDPPDALDLAKQDAILAAGVSTVYLTAPDEPKYASFKLKARTLDGAYEAEQEISFSVFYPTGWPHPAYGGGSTMAWSTPKARRAALILYDVLSQMPRSFRDAAGDIPIFLHDDLLPGVSGMHIPIPFNRYILISAKKVIGPLDVTSTEVTKADVDAAITFIHEIGHAILTAKAWANWGDFFRTVAHLSTITLRTPDLVLGRWLLSPVQPFNALFGRLGDWMTQDIVSEYAYVSGWELDSGYTDWLLRSLKGLVGQSDDHLPNILTGWGAIGWRLGLRNKHGKESDLRAKLKEIVPYVNRLEAAVKAYNAAVAETPQDPTKVAETDAKMQKAQADYDAVYKRLKSYFETRGFVSAYAATDVHEDWAEAVASMAFTDAELQKSDWYFQDSSGVRARHRFIAQKGILPKTFKGATVGTHLLKSAPKTMNQWEILYEIPELAFGKEYRPVKEKNEKPTKKGVKAFAVESTTDGEPAPEPFVDVEVPLDPKWSEGHTDFDAEDLRETLQYRGASIKAVSRFESTFAPVRPLIEPVQDILAASPRSTAPVPLFHLLTVAETHGEGLQAFTPLMNCAVGDVIFGEGGRTLIVSEVDENGQVRRVAGALDITERTSEADLLVDPETAVYRWAPTEAPREWAVPSPSPESGGLTPALNELVMLWGVSVLGEDERAVGTAEGLLAEGLKAAGLLKGAAAKRPIMNAEAFCASRGEGLVPATEETPVEVGDVVFFREDPGALGVVTRVAKEPMSFDAVIAGGRRKGVFGETADTVRMRHGIAMEEASAIWKPDLLERPWVAEVDSRSDAFDDLNKGLHAALGQLGETRVEVGKGAADVVDGAWWVLLNLMLAAGGSKEGKKAFRELSLADGSERIVRRRIYGLGTPERGRIPKPGDLFAAVHNGKVVRGVALASDASALRHALIATDSIGFLSTELTGPSILEVWTPTTQPRADLGSEEQLRFYGDPPLLWSLMRDLETGTIQGTADGEETSLNLGDPDEFAMAMAMGAPAWIRRRLWKAKDLDKPQVALLRRLDTLGKGVLPGDNADVRVGTWVFLKGGGFGVVVLTASGPNLMVVGPDFDVTEVERTRVQQVWEPSTDARAYAGKVPGYTDANAAIGMLRVWGQEKAESAVPLFGDPDLLESTFLSPELAGVLSAGPTSAEEWGDFLESQKDAFTKVGKDDMAPGDLVRQKDKQGIVVGDGEVVQWDGSKLTLVKQERFDGGLRPTGR